MTNKPGKEKAIQFNFDKMFQGFKKSRTVIYQITSTTTIKNCFKLLNSRLHRRLTVRSHWTHNLKCTYIRRSYVPYMNITITSYKHLMYVKFRLCKAQPGHPRISKMNRFPCWKLLNLDVCGGPGYVPVASALGWCLSISFVQLAISCSKSTIVTLEKGVKYVQS